MRVCWSVEILFPTKLLDSRSSTYKEGLGGAGRSSRCRLNPRRRESLAEGVLPFANRRSKLSIAEPNLATSLESEFAECFSPSDDFTKIRDV